MKKETAKAIYNKVPDWMKTILHDEFGEKTFAKDFKSIKTFSDACEAFGITEEEFEKHWSTADLAKDTLAYEKLKVIANAINAGWTPDWSNTNQPKYYPYFAVLPSGSGFSYSLTYNYYGATIVGSRLCFETSEKAEYAARQFEDIYIQFLLITK